MISSLPSFRPVIAGPFPLASLYALVEDLKTSVHRRLAARYSRCLPEVLVHRAIDDAEELARTTGLPHLFLPLIAEEKLERVSRAVCPEKAEAGPHRLPYAA